MQPLSFLEAIQFAVSRKVVLPDEFINLILNTRQMATTVSFLSGIEQIETVIKSVNQVLIDGGTFNDFKKLVEENEIILSEPYLKNVLELIFKRRMVMDVGNSSNEIRLNVLI
jgi:hypothetical protein